MIGEWTEINLELFKEIFNAYLDHSGTTTSKVVEIQNISQIVLGIKPSEETRIFFGAGVDPFDWKEDNELVCRLYDQMIEAGYGDKMKNDLSILNICHFQEGSPMISPLGPTKANIDLFFKTSFGSESDIEDDPKFDVISDMPTAVLWYEKTKDGGIYYDMSRKKDLPDSSRYVRIRAIDLEDWKDMMLEGTTLCRFPEKYKKGDLSKDSIVWSGK